MPPPSQLPDPKRAGSVEGKLTVIAVALTTSRWQVFSVDVKASHVRHVRIQFSRMMLNHRIHAKRISGLRG
jgi:hypothetical protein